MTAKSTTKITKISTPRKLPAIRYISGTIAAMNFKLGMNILPSSCYTRYELRAPPISGAGGASARVDRVRKSPFYASLWQLATQDRRLAQASNVGSVK